MGCISSDQSSKLGRNSHSQDWTASGRTSKLIPGIPAWTRHVIISDQTSSDSQTGHLRSHWQATAPAQASKFRLDISVLATLFCRRVAIEQTTSDQICKLRLDIPVQVASRRARIADQTRQLRPNHVRLDIQARTGEAQPQTKHPRSDRTFRLSPSILVQTAQTQQSSGSHSLRPEIQLHPNSNRKN